MIRKKSVLSMFGLIVVFGSALLSQQAPVGPGATAAHEFPVVMRQKVEAGKTPVSAKIQAELLVATLVNGVVIPRDAILSGEVTESVAKSNSEPSRLAICLDSAQWKGGSTPIKVCLTPWYYPLAPMTTQDVAYQPRDQINSKGNWNGQGTYPDPNNPVSMQKFPGRNMEKDTGITPGTPSSSISTRRVLMKNVQPARSDAGTVMLTSTHSNIKLDKITTYVFASGDLVSTTNAPAK